DGVDVGVGVQVRADLVEGVMVSFHALDRDTAPGGDALAGITTKQAGFQLPALFAGVDGGDFREPRVVPGELVAVGVRAAQRQGPAEAPGLSREVVVLTLWLAAVVEQIAGAKPSPRGLLKQVVAVRRIRRGVGHQEPPCWCRATPPATPMVTGRPKPLP